MLSLRSNDVFIYVLKLPGMENVFREYIGKKKK